MTPERRIRIDERARQYRHSFVQRCLEQPVKHRLRSALFHLLDVYDRAIRRADEERFRARTFDPRFRDQRLRPPSHRYARYRGPWIEEHVFRFLSLRPETSGAAYLPIFWTNFYLYAQTGVIQPEQYAKIEHAIESVLDEIANANQAFFTVSEYEFTPWGWDIFPKNVVVYSSGGGGDVAIPLMMRERPLRRTPKDIRCSFMGKLDGYSDRFGLRSEMRRKLDSFAEFGQGPHWEDVMARSTFSLAPRGMGPTSFRLHEALSMSSIPIYIWNDVRWVPYEGEIDWERFAIIVHQSEIDQVPRRVAEMEARGVDRAQDYIGEIYADRFTYPGVCRWISASASTLNLDRVLELTSDRRVV